MEVTSPKIIVSFQSYGEELQIRQFIIILYNLRHAQAAGNVVYIV